MIVLLAVLSKLSHLHNGVFFYNSFPPLLKVYLSVKDKNTKNFLSKFGEKSNYNRIG